MAHPVNVATAKALEIDKANRFIGLARVSLVVKDGM
jgi:hypothetical protein